MKLLQVNKNGIYCPNADVYIDPWKSVHKALITHGHSDHARRGHKNYLCTELTAPILKLRLGKINVSSISIGEVLNINGVKFSFHPAGHTIGSAQIRVEHKGEIWVVSGDYKTQNDGISGAFEAVPCQHFITESTFGMPVYKWQAQSAVMDEINAWWDCNKAEGKNSIITAYALGKAQRLLHHLDAEIGPIYTHQSIEKMNEMLRAQDVPIKHSMGTYSDMDKIKGAIIICPPSALRSEWAKELEPYSVAAASGWMMFRSMRRRRTVDQGFVLSDHADWDGLNAAVDATGAEHIYVTHGYSEHFSRYLRERGLDAKVLETAYEGDKPETALEA